MNDVLKLDSGKTNRKKIGPISNQTIVMQLLVTRKYKTIHFLVTISKNKIRD